MGMAYIIAVGGKVGMGMMVSVGVYTQWVSVIVVVGGARHGDGGFCRVSIITHHSSRGKGRHGDNGLCGGLYTMG